MSVRRWAALAFTMLGMAACASAPPPDPRFRPSENVLEVVAVLRRHIPDDTYRFEPASDVTGRNVYRSSLLRLENLEKVHADALRAGHWDDVIAFAKARALERLRAFDLAAQSYREVSDRTPELQREARQSAALCDALDEAARTGFDAARPPGEAEVVAAPPRDEQGVVEASERRIALLEALRPQAENTHYEAIVKEEIERADMARAGFFVASRKLTPDGDVRALSEQQRLVIRNRESKLANGHVLGLADLYAGIADDYVKSHPPEGLLFDPPTFQELVDSTSRLYQSVAAQDGTPEKLAATQRLEAFLAFTMKVDRDRFTQ
ncbi:MAG: hypothetical protein IT386_02630 [Deltaproteobacteria bacterium]|nr:hypothetical protein [Deltaproteobacteria bacterium]